MFTEFLCLGVLTSFAPAEFLFIGPGPHYLTGNTVWFLAETATAYDVIHLWPSSTPNLDRNSPSTGKKTRPFLPLTFLHCPDFKDLVLQIPRVLFQSIKPLTILGFLGCSFSLPSFFF